MALDIQRLLFDPVTGDSPTAAFRKLDNSIGDIVDYLQGTDGQVGGLDQRLSEAEDAITAANGEIDSLQSAFAGLGTAASKDVGIGSGKVAAGDDFRFRMQAFRNQIINGDMTFWQSGTDLSGSSSPNSVSWGDRWLHQAYAGSGGSGTGVVKQQLQVLTQGQTDVPSQFCNRLYVQSLATQGGTGSIIRALQYIENVNTFAGKVVAVSFYAKSNAPRDIVVSLQQQFGSGGSAAVTLNNTVSLTASWARYTVWFTVPSIAAKTVGSNSYVLLGFYLYNQDNSGGVTPVGTWSAAPVYLDYSCVQAEVVPAVNAPATDFEVRPKSVEELLVRRYSRPTSPYITGRFGSATGCRLFQPLNPPMRRAPDIALLGTTLTIEATQIAIYTSTNPSVALSGSGTDGIAIDISGTFTGGTPTAGAVAQLDQASAMILRAEF